QDQGYWFHKHIRVAHFIAMPLPFSRRVVACSTFLLCSSCTKATMERLLGLIAYFRSLKVKGSSRSLLRSASYSSVYFCSAALISVMSKRALIVSGSAGFTGKPLDAVPPIARTTIG